MKRFSAREFALLCLPILAVAGAGFWAMRRAAQNEPKVELRFEEPSGLQAARGIKTVLNLPVTQVKRKDNERLNAAVWLQLKRPNETALWRSDQRNTHNSAEIEVNSNSDGTQLVLMREVPTLPFALGYQGRVEDAATPAKVSLRFEREWSIKPSQLKVFDPTAPRKPSFKLQSVTIQKTSPKLVSGRVNFLLMGAAASGNTDFDLELAEARNCLMASKYESSNNRNSDARFLEFTVKAPIVPIGAEPLVRLTGRASAGKRWPLAFAIEPFDFTAAKVGQKLNFKSWPAPLPTDAKNKS